MNPLSFWELESFAKPYDLAVVGGGLVGCSVAYHFKQRHPNARVLLLERGLYPAGASTRNAGFACVGSVTEILDDLSKENENQVFTRVEARYEGLNYLLDLLGTSEIGYEPIGNWEIFDNETSFNEATAQLPFLNERLKYILGPSPYRIERYRKYPAILNRAEGLLHTGKMMYRLHQLVLEAGVEVRWNTTVSYIEADQLQTSIGVIKANQTVIATNGFARHLLPDIAIKPARGLVMVSKLMQQMPWKGGFHYDRGYVYFRNIEHRLLLGGARNVDEAGETTDEFGSNPIIKARLLQIARELLGIELEPQIEFEWSGIMGFSQTKSVTSRRVNQHTCVCAGLGGMGVALGITAGKDLVQRELR